MHDAEGLVQVLQPQHHLGQVDARERLLEAADALEQGVEVAAREVLHDEVEVVLALEAEEELDHKGVVRLHEDVALGHDALRVVDLDETLVLALHLRRGRSGGDGGSDSEGGAGDARSEGEGGGGSEGEGGGGSEGEGGGGSEGEGGVGLGARGAP